MIEIPKAIRDIANSQDRRLAIKFFIFFSRLEFALKRTQYGLGDEEREAKANWDLFGSRHNDTFLARREGSLLAAWKYFDEHPPRKQILPCGRLDWSEEDRRDITQPELKWLLTMIRRVRNNLFHGGKFPLRAIEEPSRDCTLLGHSLVVLQDCLEYDPAVREVFFQELG